MGVKAIFPQAGLDYWIDVAAFMHDQHDWEPAYFIGNPAPRGRVRSLFPNAVFLDNKEAVRGSGSTECSRSTFRMHQKTERARNPSFYERLAVFPNVRLVPLTYTSFDLIDAAKATATVSRTVGWESVVRETPTLLFGHSWYRGCEGVFTVRSRAEVIEAPGRIAQGAMADRRRIRLFAKAMQNRTVDGYVDKMYSQMDSVPRAEGVRNLGRKIHRANMKQNTKSMS